MLYSNKITPNGFYKSREGLEKVLKETFAFHVQTCLAYPMIEDLYPPNAICDLEEIQMYAPWQEFTPLPKHSPFRNMLGFWYVCIYIVNF